MSRLRDSFHVPLYPQSSLLSPDVTRLFRVWGLREARNVQALLGHRGVYMLLLRLPHVRIRIGALGHRQFPKGVYGYVGSARGQSVTLGHRLARHFMKKKSRHWHIDYLTSHPAVEPLSALISSCESASEERIANLCVRQFPVIPCFGNSDMKTNSGHLFLLQASLQRVFENRDAGTWTPSSDTS